RLMVQASGVSLVRSLCSGVLSLTIALALQGCVPEPQEDSAFLSSTSTAEPNEFSRWTVTTTTVSTTSSTATTTEHTETSETMTSTLVCTEFGDNCWQSRCCQNETMQCYSKDDSWASCKPACEAGAVDPNDAPEFQTPWQCLALARMPVGWVNGTFTTGYWNCCKPSCGWAGKGNVNQPPRSCWAQTHEYVADTEAQSVCSFGGAAAACPDNQPFAVNDNLSVGFAAAAVGGGHGLAGDENCGQCFELRFTDEGHPDERAGWGGSHFSLVGKTMIVQVNNIGYDLSGEHAFDIQIPGSGQGLLYNGCESQFPGVLVEDFDCGTRYGGCRNISDCDLQPAELQAGCRWRFTWYKYMVDGTNTTSNPYIQFRRVRCPALLTDISGSIPNDDASFPVIDMDSYR
ncbi:unnamed protein product, partial [Prorocentrum cordatum]